VIPEDGSRFSTLKLTLRTVRLPETPASGAMIAENDT
jgi:hypothetical protein